MATLPTPSSATVGAVYRWRERSTDGGHRAHLGASVIGHACNRHLWLLLRWAETDKFDGRVLRLFDTGKREEPRVYEELRGIGCQVWADDGSGQYRVSAHGGHFGGSLDGVVQGIPEAPKTPHVLEIKTHSAKAFKDLQKKGVKDSKPLHFDQMQTYMRLVDLDRALYYAVNKDTDEVYTERVPHDPDVSQRILDRAERIISATEPPLRLSDDPEYFECKWCRFHGQCHGTKAPEVNCRTCTHSTPQIDGTEAAWTCGMSTPLQVIPIKVQRTGCESHRFVPPMLERLGKPVDIDGDLIIYAMEDGTQFANGTPPDGFTSLEIRACDGPGMLRDRQVRELREEFPTARIVPAAEPMSIANAFDDMPSDMPWEPA